MAHWFHRNALKATDKVKFDLKMVSADSEAVKICSDLRQSRARLIDLLSDPNQEVDTIEMAFKAYLSLLLGLITSPDPEQPGQSKLRFSVDFSWTDSVAGNPSYKTNDAIYELVSMGINVAIWCMKHSCRASTKEELSADEEKAVHTALRKASGLFKLVLEKYTTLLNDKGPEGRDLHANVLDCYIKQCTAEAQEVTLSRSVALDHNPSLVSSLAHSISKTYNSAADYIIKEDSKIFGKWIKYLQLKAAFNGAFAMNYFGQNLLKQDKCGDAIAALREAKKKYQEAVELTHQYQKIKGFGMKINVAEYACFTKLLFDIDRNLEKSERENNMIYHQKVPEVSPEFEGQATYGLANPEEFNMPEMSTLWTIVAYAAFIEDKSYKTDGIIVQDGDLRLVKEVPIHDLMHQMKSSKCSIS